MTITRLMTVSFDANGDGAQSYATEPPVAVGIGRYHATGKTGNGIRIGAYDNYYGINSFPATRQIRLGTYIIPSRAFNANPYYFDTIRINSSGGILASIYANNSSVVVASCNGADRATILNPLVRSWQHWGIDLKVHSTAGWFYVWVDGVLKCSYTGNTGNADITSAWLGAFLVGITGMPGEDLYFDDSYIDDTTGEAAPARLPAYQFLVVTPNGNGATSGMTGSDGNQTDNYALVDDSPHNSDTDFVQATAPDLKDTYAMTTVTPPANTAISAVIPFAFARKPGVEDIQLKTVLRSGATEALSTAKALTASYAKITGERVTLDPNTGLAWTQTGIDALEAGVQSAGTFA